MKIDSVYSVKGRGCVAVTKDLPRGVRIGCLMHQGDKAWSIVGMEMRNPPRKGDAIGLVLQPIHHSDMPVVGPFEL